MESETGSWQMVVSIHASKTACQMTYLMTKTDANPEVHARSSSKDWDWTCLLLQAERGRSDKEGIRH